MVQGEQEELLELMVVLVEFPPLVLHYQLMVAAEAPREVLLLLLVLEVEGEEQVVLVRLVHLEQEAVAVNLTLMPPRILVMP